MPPPFLKAISVNKIVIVISHDNSIKAYFDYIIDFGGRE